MESPEWTLEDRAALLGLQEYEATLCPGCGQPKQTAWHSDMTGWWKTRQFVCLPCTAQAGLGPDGKPVERVFTQHYPDPKAGDLSDPTNLSELQLGVNTIPPSEGGGPG